MSIILPGLDQRRREVRLVRRIRVVLRLQAEAAAALVRTSALSLQLPVEKIARVELHARFGGRDLEGPAGLRLDDSRGAAQAAGRAVQHPVVIVAAAVLQLRIRLIDARADRGRLAEIERRAFNRRELARRNQRRIDRRVAIGVDRQLVTEDVARSGEIEVAVLRQVDVRRPCRCARDSRRSARSCR